MKQILVASDLSPRSHNAVERAAQLANQHGAHLTVLRVIEKHIPSDLASRHHHEHKAVLESYVRGIKRLGTIAYDVRIDFGDARRCVVSLAHELDADLIVVGQHRHAHAGNLLRGTTMDLVIRQGHIPTLVAVSQMTPRYKHIVTGIDFLEASVEALGCALRLAPQARAQAVHARHGINAASFFKCSDRPTPEEWLTTVLKRINARDRHRTDMLIEDGSPYRTFGQLTRNDGEYLLALGVNNRLDIGPMRGLIELCTRLPPCDVLLVQRKYRKKLAGPAPEV